MAYARNTYERYKTVSCSTCAAREGEPCLTRSGKVTVPHEPRQKEWWRRFNKARAEEDELQRQAEARAAQRIVDNVRRDIDTAYFAGLRQKYGA